LSFCITPTKNSISAERFYIQTPVYNQFISRITERVKHLKSGPPTHTADTTHSSSTPYNTDISFGAITMPQQINLYERLIADAVSKGARICTGGQRIRDYTQDSFYPLTVLADVTHEMDIANTEAVGPVMTILSFTDDRDLVRQVNSTVYGLGCSIFTSDLTRGDRIARHLLCGMANINDFAGVPLVQSLPFGGIKDSGFGCFNGVEGLRGFCRQQAVVTDRWSRLRTRLPGFLRYPYHHRAHEIIQQMAIMVYGKTYLQSARAAIKMVQLLLAPNKPPAVARVKQR
jgi:acyl-CoA reductase-like NAD-dependent aldehyde dehydrogenase